ncbi:MAG: gliding motility-associated C-terminal domain-containing protein [Cyclobacteriaceae bacterium]
MRRLVYLIGFITFLLGSTQELQAQPGCLSIAANTQAASCFGGNNGQIQLTITAGTIPNAQPPFDIELFFQDSGGGLTQLAFHDDVAFTTITFTPGNGSLNLPGAEAFGIPANDAVDPGSEYRINVRSTGGGLTCRNKTLTNIQISEPPELTLTGADILLGCNGIADGAGSFVAGGGTPGYTFTVDANTAGATTVATATTLDFTNADVGLITVTVEDNAGCTVQHTINITEPPALVLTPTANFLLDCSGDTDGTGTFTASGGTAPYNFAVDANTTGATETPGATTFDFSNAGVGLVTVTVTDANLCTAQATINVNQPPLLVLSTTGDILLACNGDTNGAGTFTASGGTGAYTFIVDSNTTGGTETPAATTFDLTNAGVGSITVTVRDANLCTAQATINVTEPPALTLTGADVSTSCNGASDATVTFTAGGGTPGYSFTVDSNTTGGTPVTNATTVVVNNAGVGSVVVTVRDANLCSTQHTINVTQPPVLILTPTADVSLDCNGDTDGTGTFTASGGTAPYIFTVAANTTGATETFGATTFDFSNAGVGLVTVTVTDANLCTAQATINVNQPPLLVLSTTGDILLSCNGNTNGAGTFTASGGTGAYTFTVDSNTTGGTETPAATTFDLTNAGVGSITVTVRDVNMCTAQATINVTEPPVLTLSGADVSTSCNGASDATVTFTAGGGTPGYSFTVDSNTTGGTPVTNATTVVVNNAGVGSVVVTVRDANLCSTQHTINVTQPPVLILTPTADVSLDCNGDTDGIGTFTASGGTAPYVFTVDANTTGATETFGATTFDFSSAGVGLVTVTVTDANLCTAQATINITQPPLLTLSGTPDVNLTCATDVNGSGTFTAAGGTGPYSFTVDANTTGGTETPGVSTFDFTNAGAGLVTVTVLDANLCSAQATINVIPPPPVSATISGSPTSCVGQSVGITISFVGPGPTWDFTYTDGSSNFNRTTGSNPHTEMVSPILSTTYSLVSVTDATCGAGSVSGSATVNVAPIAGNPSTFGSETWIGYVYDDSGSPAPPASNVNFNISKYRGFFTEAEVPGFSAFSSYDVASDAFDLNFSNTIPISGPNICGSYLNDFSVRMRMTKTFAAGIYTFAVGSDDGVRLLVDGVSVLPAGAFNTHAFTNYTSSPVCLTAGTHNLVLEFFDRGGFARVNFNYSATPAPTVSPVSLCVNSPAPTLTASSAGAIDFNWYTNAGLTNLVFTGANYTPAGTELDMSVVGATDFFVTAVYACGETPAAQLTVDVTNGANIVLPAPPVQVCDIGGIVDLSTRVSATPSGGSFTFSGDGVVVATSNFDPTAVMSSPATITVDYVSGTCSASTTFDIEVVSNATINVPVAAVPACESNGILDLTALVGGNPAGGVFAFSGTNVTGSDFDPTGQSGNVTITVDYNVGGCAAPTQMFDINVISNISLVVDNSTNVCPSSGSVDLTTLVTPTPAGGTFSFSGTGVTGNQFDPASSPGATVSIDVDYNLNGCSSSSTIQIVVRAATDPLCGGPTGNCATVAITPVPAPAICSPTDGSVTFNINPAIPQINNTGVRIDIVGTSASNADITRTNFNDPLFSGLPVGSYDYTIEYGDPSCIKTGTFTVLLGPDVVDFTAASNNANCFGSSGGVVLSNINGSKTADYTYEVIQLGSVVSSGTITQLESLTDVTLTGFGTGDFEIKLSQDQSGTTSCTNPVQSAFKPFTVTGATANLDTLYVTKTISVPDLPTGSMIVGIEESLQEPYEVRLELTQPLFPGQVFAQDFTEATRNNNNLKVEFSAPNLFAGTYLLSLRDAIGCRKDYQVNIAVDNNLMIPNIFTPNGDGVNEVFFIRNIPDATELMITNRWGKEVFSSSNYQNDWNGGDVADGVYYYRINAGGQSYSGWVEVLRGK